MEQAKNTKNPVVDEIATAKKDLDIYAGWTNLLENPDPILRSEASGKGMKLYDEVERDGHAGAVLQQRFLTVVSRPWDVIPADDSPRSDEIAEFVKEAMGNANFLQAMAELLLGILYGFYVLEVMWKEKAGRYVISKFRAKHPKRFNFTVDRDLRLLTPENMIDGEPVPDKKFIVFSYGSSDNPYGKGLGQKMWWPVWFKKHGIKFWMIFLDKFGSPTPVGKYPPGGDKEKTHKDKLLDAIDALQQETGVVIPDGMSIELLEATRGGHVTYESLCEYMDKQNTKTVLSQTGTTDISDAGAYNASQTLDEVRQAICEADADQVCECFNETLVPWLVDYNFADVTDYPEFVIHTKPSKNSKDHAETDEILIKNLGLKVGKKYLYEKYNIPEPEAGEELLELPAALSQTEPVPARQEAAGKETKNVKFSEFSESLPDQAFQDEIDKLVDRQVGFAIPVFAKNIAIVKAYLAKTKSLKKAETGLPDLLDRLDSDRLASVLSRGLNAAWEIGEESVGDGADFSEVLWGPGTVFKTAMEYFEARSFYISRVSNADILFLVEDELKQAMEGGMTLDDFKENVDGIFKTAGVDPLYPYHIKIIFQTNLHINYQGGRYFQMKRPAVVMTRPFWRYIAVADGNTRPAHWANHGKIFPHDHAFWDTWYPPNGYNCRCTVVSVSRREMDKNGWTVETKDPTGRMVEPTDPATGVKMMPRNLMPDTGWAKNVAAETWTVDFSKYSPVLAASLKTKLGDMHA